MTQQKSERCIVAQAAGNRGPTEPTGRGAKATSVGEQAQPLGLFFGTAENCSPERLDAKADGQMSLPVFVAGPKPEDRE